MPVCAVDARRQRGAFLLDFAIPAVVVGLLFAVGAPSLHAQVAKTRVQSATFQLVNSLAAARSAAVERGALVTMRPSTGRAGAWRDGWVAFVDKDRDGTLGVNEEVLFEVDAVPESINVWTESRFANRLSFDATGRIIGLGGALIVCASSGSETQRNADRMIFLSANGRVRVESEFDRPDFSTACRA